MNIMPTQENLTYTKHTVWKFLKWTLFSKTESYSEVSSEGEPFKIIVNQDYFNKEFNIGKDKGNNQKS